MKPIFLVYEEHDVYNVRRLMSDGRTKPHKNYRSRRSYSYFCRDAANKGYYIIDLPQRPSNALNQALIEYCMNMVQDEQTKKELRAIAKRL